MSRRSACGFGDFDDPQHRSMCIMCSRAAGEFIAPWWTTLIVILPAAAALVWLVLR